MPAPKRPRRTAVTVKIDAALADEVRAFVRREVGRPLYIQNLSAFAAQAFKREMERLGLVVSGALPLDRAAGQVESDREFDAPDPTRSRRVNATQRKD